MRLNRIRNGSNLGPNGLHSYGIKDSKASVLTLIGTGNTGDEANFVFN